MAEDRLTIDTATIDDNTDQRRVEFDADVSELETPAMRRSPVTRR